MIQLHIAGIFRDDENYSSCRGAHKTGFNYKKYDGNHLINSKILFD
jgi:hypothetical protein